METAMILILLILPSFGADLAFEGQDNVTANSNELSLGEEVVVSTVTPNGSTISDAVAPTAEAPREILRCEVITLILKIVLGFLCIFGLVGNTFSMITFWPTIKKNATSFILISLAFFDDGVCLVWFLNSSIPTMCTFGDNCVKFMRYQYQYMRLYLWPIGSFFHLAGTWTIALVTFHRYLAVCQPHAVAQYGSLSKAHLQVVAITILAFLINVPRATDEVLRVSEDGKEVYSTIIYPNHELFVYLYEVAIYYLLIFVLPFIILFVLTYKIMRALVRTREKREQMTRSKKDEADLTTTLIVVVVVFLICQTMNPIRRLLSIALDPKQQICGTSAHYFSTISSIFVCFNSCGNFVIYCIFSTGFRRRLKRRLCRCFKKVHPMDSSHSVTHTLPAPSQSVNPGGAF